MTATSSTASTPKKRAGAVARSEMNGHFKTIKFQGLKLNLPGTTKLGLLRNLTSGDTDELVDALTMLLGEEQMAQVYDIDVDISQGIDALADLFLGLANEVFKAYGTTAGESQASPQP